MNTEQRGAVDTHAHVYPAFYLALLEEAGVPASSTAIARNMQADSTEADLEARLAWAERAGVATQIIAVTPQSPTVAKASDGDRLASIINDHYLEICQRYPGSFAPYAALPLPHVRASIAQIDRTREGFVGYSLPAFLPGGGSLADEALQPVWEKLDEVGAIVNIHPTGQGACAPTITGHHLEWVNGAPVEDATATLQLLKAGIPQSYPNMTFHIAHLGGDLAFLAQRIEDNYTDWGSFPSSPREAMRAMFFDAANFHEPSLALAAETYGVGQILAGSDYPYFREELYVRAFDYIRTSRLSVADKGAILSGNAHRLFGAVRGLERP